MCINLPTMYIKYKQGYGQYKPYLLTPLKKHKPTTTNLQLVNSPKNLMQSFYSHYYLQYHDGLLNTSKSKQIKSQQKQHKTSSMNHFR